jgi:predicted transcriptional regulator
LPGAATYLGASVKQPFVNVEEKIDRFVGRRTKTPDSLQAGMQLQETARQLHQAFNHRWCRKGVYRFKTHEEADAWMTQMLARSGMATT